ncbi:hypothetical protein [Actinomadura opuntiae]|uniref:hypothetical protein n=1 Tax=Actinomadura sp. OS1-43 TaxID=604315 RepID=UPI00255A97B6|nr:hypothetical protein [Actinomadura sp. OS1-43]MDL4812737.1 hypothetical protein [Actinomadura sp. OS1-43]
MTAHTDEAPAAANRGTAGACHTGPAAGDPATGIPAALLADRPEDLPERWESWGAAALQLAAELPEPARQFLQGQAHTAELFARVLRNALRDAEAVRPWNPA